MPESFRPYPEEGADTKGEFHFWPFFRDTILNGPFQFAGIIPHIVLPFYLAYRVLKGAGYWTAHVEYVVDYLLIPLLQGLSLGGFLSMVALRYGTEHGRLVGKKRKEDSATSEEDLSQHRIEVALYAFLYLGFATILWHNYPSADSKGVKSFKRVLNRLQNVQVGLDLGDGWRAKSK